MEQQTTQENYKILIVEDEEAIAAGLVDLCRFRGFEATHAADGEEGLRLALTGNYDLILLDIMLPKMDGFTVCDQIREKDREVPIIILSAKTAEEDIIEGLKLGADDYVNKPFSVPQLFARMEAVMRRTKKSFDAENQLVLGEMTIYFREYLGRIDEQEIPFTRKEMEVLQYLSQHRNGAVSRKDLLRDVWGYENADSIDTRTVDIHVTKIRKKIEKVPSSPVFLVTVRGEGYLLRAPRNEG